MTLPNPRYNYLDLTLQELIDQAFLYVEVPPANIDQLKVKTALFAANEILSTWINIGVLQFNEIIQPVKLENNVLSYALPKEVYDIFDVTVCTLGRQRAGNPYSTAGGNPVFAFDDNYDSACTQTEINGSLGILFPTIDGSVPRVDYVGVLSAVDAEYTLTIEGSNSTDNFIPLLENIRTQEFKGIKSPSGIVWYALKTPKPFSYLQIRETGGATLNITELYFETYINSRYIQSIGRSRYMQISAKSGLGSPSLYSMQKNNSFITLNMYGVPSNLPVNQDFGSTQSFQNFLVCRGASLPFSLNYLNNVLNLNPRFIGALRAKLTAELAAIYKPDKLAFFKAAADEVFTKSLYNDSDGGGLRYTLENYRA